MSYANSGTGRERIVAIGLVGLIQGGIIAALLSGLAVQFIGKTPDKPLETYAIPIDTPPPPPVEKKPIERAAVDTPTTTLPRLPDLPTPTIDLDVTTPTMTGTSIPIPGPIELPTIPTPPTPTPTPLDVSRGASPLGNVGAWFPQDAYPAQALRAEAEGRASVSLSVSSTGKVTDCRIVSSTGNAALDAATCRLAIRNGRFEPARDAAGNPVATQMRLPPIVWRIVN